jgi:chromate transport protein ChrA
VAGTVLVHVSFFLWNRWFVALIVLVVALIAALIWRFSKGNKKSKK